MTMHSAMEKAAIDKDAAVLRDMQLVAGAGTPLWRHGE
ncbi:hypothetical protein AB691_1672 [Stutzerimonas stutzeri]|nr:hypothetical protein AB691_1672 [Stutzerimonas stutzeri]